VLKIKETRSLVKKDANNFFNHPPELITMKAVKI
jgi:hypothetical protein